jgi:uncharacterized protein (DUF1015 family)
MPAIAGLTGLRVVPERAADVTVPPYDVIKEGSPLSRLLIGRPDSLYHVTLGDDPVGALRRLQDRGALIRDDEPCFYVYEQRWQDQVRRGVFAAVETAPYASGRVRRHEKTFDDKVRGRLELTRRTGLTLEPIFLLTRQDLDPVLAHILTTSAALHQFTSDFGGQGDLHGIANRIVRVPADADLGRSIAAVLSADDLYIADGHHRYHAALLGGQTHALAYITGGARILAYDRVIRGTVPFATVRDRLTLVPTAAFVTPPPRHFAIYHAGRSYTIAARTVPTDVVGRLDCSILERELYPLLGLRHEHIMDPAHFDYYPESELAAMQAAVDGGRYDLAVALHPVAVADLMAVADAGLADPAIVMPEKSTFFSPKILSGIIVYRHRARG